MELLKQVLQKKLLTILSLVIILPLLISCPQVQNTGKSDIPISEFMDFTSLPEEGLLLRRWPWLLDDAIEKSEFCAIGERTINYYGAEKDDKPGTRPIFRTDGKVKINSIVYGNPGTDEISFSYFEGWAWGGACFPLE